MIKRFQAVLLVLWVVIIATIMQFFIYADERNDRTGAYVDGYMADGTAYVADKRASGSYIYKIGKDYKAEKIKAAKDLGFECFETVIAADEGVAAVISKSGVYQIILLNDSLNAVKKSDLFALPAGKKFSSLSQEAGIWYVSSVSTDGREACVYSLDSASFSEILPDSDNTEAESAVEAKNVQVLEKKYDQRAQEGTFYSRAAFVGNVLYIQVDNEVLADIFAKDKDAENAYFSASIDIIWRNRILLAKALVFLVFILSGAAVLFLNIILYTRKPFFTRSLSIIIVFAVVLAGFGILETFSINYRVRQQTISMFSDDLSVMVAEIDRSSLLPEDPDALFENEDYSDLRDVINIPAADILLLSADGDGRIIISRSGECRMPVSELYGQDVYEVYRQALQNGAGYGIARILGTDYVVCARSMSMDYDRDVVIAGLYKSVGVDYKNMHDVLTCLILVLGFAAICVILWNSSWRRRLKALYDGMVEVSKGNGEVVKIPNRKTAELSRHWDALGEISMVFRRMNYESYQAYKAYFRFAPKKIETFLDKNSIAEVRCGDTAMFSGTEAILTLSDDLLSSEGGIDEINDFIRIMEKHQEKEDGVLISSDVSLGLVKLAFKEGKDVLSFGVDFWHEAEALWPKGRAYAGMVLHYGTFRYGVIGTVTQSMVFMDSPESGLIEKYSPWLKDMGLGLIITDSVIKHEGIDPNNNQDLRYIGFIEEDGIKLDLFEVLDANKASTGLKKKSGLNKYYEALENFKAQDFYFARNAFSELLKDNPEDAIVKWYMFESERYLDQAPGGELLRLHMD